MYKKSGNGFTLIELMAVIVIISLIALLTFPNIINKINKTKKSNNKMIEDVVIEQAKKYVNDNSDDFQEKKYCLSIDTLVAKGYINDNLFKNTDYLDKKIINITNSNDDGYNFKILDKDKCNTYDYVDNDGNGYYEVEYIKSTGEQYIDTEIKHTGNDIKQTMTISFTNYVSSGEYGLISTWTPSYIYSNLYLNTAKKIRSYWGSGSNMENPVNIELNTKYNIEHIYDLTGSYGENHIRSLKINDTIVSTLFEGTSSSNPNTFKIFSRADLNYKSFMRLYVLKLYIDGHLVRDYIPVINSSEKPCLFDKVENKCYYNQGTGEFLYG